MHTLLCCSLMQLCAASGHTDCPASQLDMACQDPDSKNHKLTQHVCDVLQETHEQHACPCRNILAVVGPPGSGKSALVAAMCGRLYKPAKAIGKIMISGREAYESFKPTWFSANDVLTSHLTVHQYLLYKGVCVCAHLSSVWACTEGTQHLAVMEFVSFLSWMERDHHALQHSHGSATRSMKYHLFLQ